MRCIENKLENKLLVAMRAHNTLTTKWMNVNVMPCVRCVQAEVETKKPTILPVLAAIMHTCVSCFAANDVYVPWITHDRQIFYVLFATLPIPPSHDARACVSVSAVAIIFPASIHIR